MTDAPDFHTLEQIEAEVAEAIAATNAWVAKQPKPRDTMPLAAYTKGWDR